MSDQFDYLTDAQRRKLRLRQISNDRDLADMLSDERNRTRVQNLLELSEDSLTEVLSTLKERGHSTELQARIPMPPPGVLLPTASEISQPDGDPIDEENSRKNDEEERTDESE